MQYKNISDSQLSVGNVNGLISVAPGDEVFTAPIFGKPLVKQGLLEEIPIKTSTKTRKSAPKGEAS